MQMMNCKLAAQRFAVRRMEGAFGERHGRSENRSRRERGRKILKGAMIEGKITRGMGERGGGMREGEKEGSRRDRERNKDGGGEIDVKRTHHVAGGVGDGDTLLDLGGRPEGEGGG